MVKITLYTFDHDRTEKDLKDWSIIERAEFYGRYTEELAQNSDPKESITLYFQNDIFKRIAQFTDTIKTTPEIWVHRAITEGMELYRGGFHSELADVQQDFEALSNEFPEQSTDRRFPITTTLSWKEYMEIRWLAFLFKKSPEQYMRLAALSFTENMLWTCNDQLATERGYYKALDNYNSQLVLPYPVAAISH